MKTEILRTETPAARKQAVAAAVGLLRAGETVALPTETVYGLAADALQAEAAVKIFAAKERPGFDPLIVHLPSADWLDRLTDVPLRDEKMVQGLTSAFWPGPFTIVLPRRAVVPDIVTAGLETVAVRISAGPTFREVIEAFGRPLAAPSANRFGRISPTSASDVAAELDGRIPLIVDGGPTRHGLESTIVAVREEKIEILRPGPISPDQLAEWGEVRHAAAGARIEAPGQSRSHYAPQTPLVVAQKIGSFETAGAGRVGCLSFRCRPDDRYAEIRVLSASGDIREAAANLFRCLRELDDAQLDLIVAEEISETGLGHAIMDRLRRAAAAPLD